MGTMHVYNPTVKYTGIIPGGMRPGILIRIKGVINTVGKRCVINIGSGLKDEDISLHLSIRPDENVIVRNHLHGKKWGVEERCGISPIRYRIPFDILILGEKDRYCIAINGKHFTDFKHRCSIKETKYLTIEEDCKINFIGISEDITSTHFNKQTCTHPTHLEVVLPDQIQYPHPQPQ